MTMVGADSECSEGGTNSLLGGNASAWELPTVTWRTLLSDWMSALTLMGVPLEPVLGVLKLEPTLDGVP